MPFLVGIMRPPENPFLKPPPRELSFSFLALFLRSEIRPILSWVKILAGTLATAHSKKKQFSFSNSKLFFVHRCRINSICALVLGCSDSCLSINLVKQKRPQNFDNERKNTRCESHFGNILFLCQVYSDLRCRF